MKQNKRICDFQQLKMIRSFGENIISSKITISEVDEDLSNLLKNIVDFDKNIRPRTKEGRTRKKILLIL